MGIQEIQNNPAFLIVRQEDDYMFYNSINHKAFRLNAIELELLNLLYTYEDQDYVFSLFEGDIKTEVVRIAEVIEDLEILNLEYQYDSGCDNVVDVNPSSTFYIHLTNNCNLSCSYCYNQEWRKNGRKALSYNDWGGNCLKDYSIC